MLIIVDIALLGLFGGLTLYLALLSGLALAVPARRVVPAGAFKRFAVVIPSHNEQLTLSRTLDSILAVHYPRSLFDAVVIADNCEDGTAGIGRDCGAIVYERTDAGNRGKGYALRWAFDTLLSGEKDYDAFVIVDADSLVSSNFLQVMNCHIGLGAAAIQCNDQVQSQPGAWSAESTRLGFTLYNYVRPLGRLAVGLSAGLRGNGMCFTAETLRKFPWNAYSLNEDLQYGLDLLLNGVSVAFAPEATVLATMPSDAAHAETQRARWEHGRFPIILKYTPKLLWSAVRNFSFKPLDAAIDLLTPPFVNLMGASFVVLCANLALWAARIPGAGALCAAWLIVLGLCFFHVFAGLRAAAADASLYGALAHVPRYAVWKLLLYAKLWRREAPAEWIRTFREH